MSLGQYIPGSSFIHKLDPRVKIAITILYMIAIFFVNSFIMYLPMVIYILLVVKIAGLDLRRMLKSLRPLLFIIIFTSVLNIITTPGEELFKIWKVVITKEGLIRAIFMSLRLILLVLGTSLMTLTTSPISLTDGLESIFSPLKVIKFPAHELSMMISISLRFIPTLFDEADKIRKAQMARGADFESGNVFRRAKNMIPLLVPLFINSFRRADELAVAMESRCYRGSEGRTRLNPLKMESKDLITLAGAIVVFILIVLSKNYI